MSYHRTGGKGGTRNSVRERHADRFLPNFNKSTSGGHTRRPLKGKRKDNPPTSKKDQEYRQRYDDMMFKAKNAGIKPTQSALNKLLAGKSGIL